jgi:hypothetical protein
MEDKDTGQKIINGLGKAYDDGFKAGWSQALEELHDEIEKTKGKAALKIFKDIAFKAGVKDALYKYAWMKDGVYYVGTSGTTYKDALKEYDITD